MAPLKRHVAWPLDEQAIADWPRVHVGPMAEADKFIAWIEDNLQGAWTSATMTRAQVRAELGVEPEGGIYLRIAFALAADADLFSLYFVDAYGRA
jgi:hypothetical protein